MRIAEKIVIVLLVITAVAFLAGGFYIGLMVCLFGGIADAVNILNSDDPVGAGDIFLTIVKIIFFEVPIVIGVLIAAMCGLLAAAPYFNKK